MFFFSKSDREKFDYTIAFLFIERTINTKKLHVIHRELEVIYIQTVQHKHCGIKSFFLSKQRLFRFVIKLFKMRLENEKKQFR